MTDTYESIRDNSDIIPQDVRMVWIEADQKERMLRYQYDRVEQDGDLTPEAKSRRAAEIYERDREAIQRRKQAAKDALIKASKSAAKSSIPRPSGEATSSTDPTKLLLDQNEANRLIRTIERRKGQGPFHQGSSEYMAQEYRRGLEVGGVEGGSICRGVLRAAQELGIGEDWLHSLRNDSQRKLLDDSRRLEYFSGLIATSAPKPPRSLEKAARRSREQSNRRAAPLLVPVSGPAIPTSGSSSSGTSKAAGATAGGTKKPRRRRSG